MLAGWYKISIDDFIFVFLLKKRRERIALSYFIFNSSLSFAETIIYDKTMALIKMVLIYILL